MTIFDDEIRRFADEERDRIRADATQQPALNQVAQDIAHEVIVHLGKFPILSEDIDVGILHNIVSLRGKFSRRSLQIVCQGPDAFELDDSRIGFQTQVSEPFRTTSTGGRKITQREMVREVLAWLNERNRGRAASS